MPHDTGSICTTLRPLDFTNLSSYHDPVWAPVASPQNPWASVMSNPWTRIASPLRSARRGSPTIPHDSPLFSSLHPGSSGSPLFASFSPLFKTPRAFKAWPSTTLHDPLAVDTTQQFYPDKIQNNYPSADQDKNITAHTALHTAPHIYPKVEEKTVNAETQTTLAELASISPSEFTASSTDFAQSQPRAPAAPVYAPPDAIVEQNNMRMTRIAPAKAELSRNVSTNMDIGGKTSLSRDASATRPAKDLNKNEKSKISRKSSQTMSSIDKAAERRRKNRESSSRCYYNRKRIIESLDNQISEEKNKLTALYDRALELRHENARLKKDVVTNGIALPTKIPGCATARPDSAFQLRGYFELLQSASYQPAH